jgi:epsilon-lactone hydrolase
MASWQNYLLKQGIRLNRFASKFKNQSIAEERISMEKSVGISLLKAKLKYPNVSFEPVNIDSLKAEWIRPKKTQTDKYILYLHGGGYRLGSCETHRGLCAELLNKSDVNILIIEYGLAPERPYPAGLNDCLDAYNYLLSITNNPDKIIVGGDSAGGCLALGMLLKLKNLSIQQPKAVFCFSPATDLTRQGESFISNKSSDVLLDFKTMVTWKDEYLNGHSETDPFASALFGDLSGLPPILIHVSSAELLYDDSVRFIDKAIESNVRVTYRIWHDLQHVWQLFFDFLPEARESLEEVNSFINSEFELSYLESGVRNQSTEVSLTEPMIAQ